VLLNPRPVAERATVLVSVPVAFGVSVMPTVAVAAVASDPTLHVSLTGVVVLAVQVPPVVLTEEES
jgi:hypothetical protein